MQRLIFLLFSILLFIGCRDASKKNDIEFKYSAYSFHLNPKKWVQELYLAFHFSVDKAGNYKIFKHETFMDNPKYYIGKIEGDFKQEIDSLILLVNESMPIIILDTPLLVYDGFTYCLDYKVGKQDSAKIQFIQAKERTPAFLLDLAYKLNALIINKKRDETDSFSLVSYIDTLKRISDCDKIPAPVKASPIQENQIKFIPPKK